MEDVDRGDSKTILENLDIVTKLRELDCEDRVVNLLHLPLAWVGKVDQVELGSKTRGKVSSTTTRLTHGSQNLKLAHEVLDNLLAIIPEACIEPLTDELDRRLSTELFTLGHVKVIDEAHSL